MQVADPVTLFERPENAFVAGFIGTPEMNLATGKLALEGRPSMSIGTQSIALDDAVMSRLEPNNGDVTIGIRPQHLELAPVDSRDVFRGHVTALEFMGHEVYLHVSIEENNFIAVVPVEKFNPSIIRGSEVALKANLNRLHIFERETGRNISLSKVSTSLSVGEVA